MSAADRWVVMVVGTSDSEAFGPFLRKANAEAVRDRLAAIVDEDVEVGLERLTTPTAAALESWRSMEKA